MSNAAVPAPASYFTTLMGSLVTRHPRFWIRLGNLETKVLEADLASHPVRAPVYVCGLARSGSTLLLEMLAAHPSTTSHRYQDFPFLFTPYWWNTVLKFTPFQAREMRERAHGDRMLVNALSPEAMEEILWNAFFPDNHNIAVSQVMAATEHHERFERFYREHIQKLLLVRKAQRYVSKGNYNLTRMRYLLTIFPDARFVIPVRHPVSHIASLMRQHKRFCEAARGDPRVVTHMNMGGHFEFGLNRTPINTGNREALNDIMSAWARGDEVRGWALYWNMLYDFVLREMASDPLFARAAMIVPHESLCDRPGEMMEALFRHCLLTPDNEIMARFTAGIRRPDYYDPGLNEEQQALITDLTSHTARRLGCA